MKTVFTGGPALRRVYAEKTLSRIAELSGAEPVFADEIPADTEALFTTWGMRSYTADHIKQNFPCLKYIFYGAGTVQSFARPFMENGVRIFSAWQANGVPVAEFTVSQIILCGKRYFDVFTGGKALRRRFGIRPHRCGIFLRSDPVIYEQGHAEKNQYSSDNNQYFTHSASPPHS